MTNILHQILEDIDANTLFNNDYEKLNFIFQELKTHQLVVTNNNLIVI